MGMSITGNRGSGHGWGVDRRSDYGLTIGSISWIYEKSFERHPNYSQQFEELVDTVVHEGAHQVSDYPWTEWAADEQWATVAGRLGVGAFNKLCSPECPFCD